jgi:hypothetical protein
MKKFDKRLQKIDGALHQKFGEVQLSGKEVRKRLMERGLDEFVASFEDETYSIRRPDGDHNRRVRELSNAEILWICLYGNEG